MNEDYLIKELGKISDYDDENLTKDKRIRAMMNRVIPLSLDEEFYQKEREYLLSLLNNKKIVDVNALSYKDKIAIYKGDITLIKADAIVNAGNSQLLGCFVPLHNCIDNCIHSFGGLEIRRDLIKILKGKKVKNASVKVTKGYSLPAKYIFHTVGPIYNQSIQNALDLSNCYLNCLKQADKMKLQNIVFCSISTGLFGYPIEEASTIAINTTRQYLNKTKSSVKVIFDLFSEDDYKVYERKIKRNI